MLLIPGAGAPWLNAAAALAVELMSGKPEGAIAAGALGDSSRSIRLPASEVPPLGSFADACTAYCCCHGTDPFNTSLSSVAD